MDLSEMFRFSVVVVVFSTSHLEIGDSECEGEVEGDDEGDLLLEWVMDLNSLAIHSSGPPSSAKYVEAPKIGSTTRGIPTRSGTWLEAPYPFGIAGPTGDDGTSFPTLGVCV